MKEELNLMIEMLSDTIGTRAVDALGFLLAFALTALMDSMFRERLPHDHGRAFAVNGELSKGKARGSGLIFVLCIALVTLAVVPFKVEYLIYTVLLIASMLSGYFDDASETAWNEYKKGLIDFVIAVVAGVTYLNFNGTSVNFMSTTFTIAYPLYLLGRMGVGDPVALLVWIAGTALVLFLTLYIIALFSAKGWMGYAVMAVTLAACVKVSHVGLRALVRGLKPLVFIIAFTGILNMFFTPDTHYLWEWGILRVSVKGIENALFMVIRIMLLVMGTFLMTYTTSPIRLTDGLESLLNPLKKIHVPVHELAMMMAIALRFIPTLIEETDKIMSAQKARGADFDSGNIFQKAKALVPILVPLFISAFRRADELATAMECRCYHGGEGRTRLKVLKFGALDVKCAVVLTLCLAVILSTRWLMAGI